MAIDERLQADIISVKAEIPLSNKRHTLSSVVSAWKEMGLFPIVYFYYEKNMFISCQLSFFNDQSLKTGVKATIG